MTEEPRLVIIGAGHGGGALATALRQGGFSGSLLLIGEERVAPYQRPPLSKDYLKGSATLETLNLRTDQFYADREIGLRLGARVESIDRIERQVRLVTGESIAYDLLVLATGSRPRRIDLPGSSLKGVHELRSVADADALKAALGPGRRIALIGGGYIGLEVAASAIGLGGAAVVIEREPRLLARVASAPLSAFLQEHHQSRGMEILTDCQVAGLDGDEDGFVNAVLLKDGRRVTCDSVLLCVGGVPNDELARKAGLPCDGGVVVDLAGRTSDPAIFALGDATRRPLPLYDGRMFRLESVPNALEQGKQIAAAILAKPAPAPEVPWFWSNQFELRLQIAGLSFEADTILVRGNPVETKFSVCHLKAGRLICVEAVNNPADFLAAKSLVAQKAQMSLDRLGDSATPLKAAMV